MPNVVTEKEVVAVLCNALPMWNPPTVPSAFHELKLWGRHAVFTKEMLPIERSGDWLVASLLDESASQRNLSGDPGHYLLDSPFGIRIVRIGSDDATDYRGQAHYGQLLKVLGEVGVTAYAEVTTSSGKKGAVEDIIRDEIMQYAHAGELEFMAIALAYWLPPQKTWRNQFNQEFSFDLLMQFLIDLPWGKGSCGGCHVPYAVVCLLRVDEIHPILAPGSREKARAWLNRLMAHLEQKWAEQGAWDHRWAEASASRYLFGDELLDRITITGHHLEWMAVLPGDLAPDETLVRRAVQCLCADVSALPPIENRSFKSLLPVSHGGRALALLRGVDPFEIWKKYWENGLLKKAPKGYCPRDDL
jgi:hypothetical protein